MRSREEVQKALKVRFGRRNRRRSDHFERNSRVSDPEEGWEEKLKDYPTLWHVGASESVSDLYDLRKSPSVYVIDREGKIAVKNVGIETAMQIATAAAEQ